MQSLDFVATRFLMKIFRTVNHVVICDSCKFLPCDAMRCTAVFVIVILSVCPSVCPSHR